MMIHAIQTGRVTVKTAHRTLRGIPALRFPRILLDRHYSEPWPILAFIVEHPEGLIVIDTGESALASDSDYFACDPAYHLFMRRFGLLKLDVAPEQEIGPQLRSIGLSPGDVRWVVMTHLHTDHAGGLHHFPNAEILVSRREYEGQKRSPRGAIPCRWPSWFSPTLVDHDQAAFGPFTASRTLTRAGDVVLLPTPGHSYGHQSVLLRDGDRSVLFAGDASFSLSQLRAGEVAGIVHDVSAARTTLRRVEEYLVLSSAVYLPSHDPASVMRLEASDSASTTTGARLGA